MSKKNWRFFLIDILESIEKIERYVREFSFEDFMRDEKTKDVVLWKLTKKEKPGCKTGLGI
jgi:uncharacterized protein with HEPN domain